MTAPIVILPRTEAERELLRLVLPAARSPDRPDGELPDGSSIFRVDYDALVIESDQEAEAYEGRCRSGRFAQVPVRAIEDQRIGNAAFRVLACLASHADKEGWCRLNVTTIGERLQLARPTVVGHAKILKKLGYLEIHPSHREDGGNAPNQFRIYLERRHET